MALGQLEFWHVALLMLGYAGAVLAWIHRIHAGIERKAGELVAALAEFKLKVAEEYVTAEKLIRVEERLVQSIDRMSDRLDRVLDAFERRGGARAEP
jgi:hypothetical protein